MRRYHFVPVPEVGVGLQIVEAAPPQGRNEGRGWFSTMVLWRSFWATGGVG